MNPVFAAACYFIAITISAWLTRHPRIREILSTDAGARQLSIDGLRGYLAFGVFIHHLVIYIPYLETGVFELPSSNFYSQLGRTSVALFFMITGYLFWARAVQADGQLDWRRFLFSRLFRIYPLYLATLVVVVFVAFARSGFLLNETLAELLRSIGGWLLFLRPDINGHPRTGDLIANVSWTLSYEFFFYLALPALSLIFIRRRAWVHTLLAIMFVYGLYKLMGASAVLKHSVLASFLGGVAAAYWTRSDRCRAISQGWAPAIIALLALGGVMVGWPSAFSLPPLSLLTIFFCIVASGNCLFGVLRPRPIRWLGEISYSTYLLHGLILWLGLILIPETFSLDARTPAYLAVFALWGSIALIVVSSLTYLLIERPGIALGRRMGRRSTSLERASHERIR